MDCGEVVTKQKRVSTGKVLRCPECQKNHRSFLAKKRNANRTDRATYREKNRTFLAEKSREYHKKNPQVNIKSGLKNKYGMTVEEYDLRLGSQGGGCFICRRGPGSMKRRMPVDHDHRTGKVRGILCHKCNVSLGFMGDNIEEFYFNAERLEKYLLKDKNENSRPVQSVLEKPAFWEQVV